MTKSTPEIVVLGAGGHARVVVETLRASGVSQLACIAPTRPDERWATDVPWMGADDAFDSLPSETLLVNGIGSVGDTRLRKRVYTEAVERGFRFHVLTHPSAHIASDVQLQPGAQVMAGAVVQTGTVLAENTIVNTGAIIDHNGRIGAHSHIGPGATLSGDVVVGEGVHIGTGATVIQGITIEERAVVGAGAVVIADVVASMVVVGVPARPASRSGT